MTMTMTDEQKIAQLNVQPVIRKLLRLMIDAQWAGDRKEARELGEAIRAVYSGLVDGTIPMAAGGEIPPCSGGTHGHRWESDPRPVVHQDGSIWVDRCSVCGCERTTSILRGAVDRVTYCGGSR